MKCPICDRPASSQATQPPTPARIDILFAAHQESRAAGRHAQHVTRQEPNTPVAAAAQDDAGAAYTTWHFIRYHSGQRCPTCGGIIGDTCTCINQQK